MLRPPAVRISGNEFLRVHQLSVEISTMIYKDFLYIPNQNAGFLFVQKTVVLLIVSFGEDFQSQSLSLCFRGWKTVGTPKPPGFIE